MFPFRNRIADLCALVKLGGDCRGSKHGSHLRVLSHHHTPHNSYCNICCAELNSRKRYGAEIFFFFSLFSHWFVSCLLNHQNVPFTLVIVNLLTSDIESLLHTHVMFFCTVCIFTSAYSRLYPPSDLYTVRWTSLSFVVTFANARYSPSYPVWLIDLCFLANLPRELQDVLT